MNHELNKSELNLMRELDSLVSIESMKNYNMVEAAQLLGVSYRTIRYYKDIFTEDVYQIGRNVMLTEKFIHKVQIWRMKYDLLKKSKNKQSNEVLNNKLKEAQKIIDRLTIVNRVLTNKIKEVVDSYKLKKL